MILQALLPHLLLVPILLPVLTAAGLLLLGEGRRPLKGAISATSALLGLATSVVLLTWVDRHGPLAYLPGNWAAPFGITVVADRLSTLMLVLASLVGLASILFSTARWHRAGVHFHPLAQLQLMGLAGAFLTGDLFNLFVFFEITLAASYGLVLHGSGRARVLAGLHYVVINLAASSLFLIGATLLYGVTGTLNLADLSLRVLEVAPQDRSLLHAAAAILAVAFLVKAAVWPLNFWLVPAYAAATPPVAGMFAILTKVGVYAVARLWTLLFSGGPSAGFGGDALLLFGLVTVFLGALGLIGASRLAHLAGFCAVVSSGTVLAALSFGQAALSGGALFYLFSSTLTASAFFLLIDLVDRWRRAGATLDHEAPYLSPSLEKEQRVNLDDDQEQVVGWPFPVSTALMGLAFMACTLLFAGLPPLSSFVAKFAMLSAAVGDGTGVGLRQWLFLAVLLGSGLLTLVALLRAGVRVFWSTTQRPGPRVRVSEGLPVLSLLSICLGLTLAAGPVMGFVSRAALALHAPDAYRQAVLSAPVVPSPPEATR
ncbi:MAG: monovalent cation/H+ antiporter subunit D [Myxococcota bacterium]|nr:monovalent cation/H+ antiporter subunit D [Myxococcota bacterium]